jgi:hypothetical protein
MSVMEMYEAHRAHAGLVALLALVLAVNAGCSKKDGGESGESGETAEVKQEPKEETKAETKADEPAKIDETFVKAIKKIAEVCTIDTEYANVKSCPADEHEALSSEFYNGTRKPDALLDTVAQLLQDSDEKVKAVTVFFVYSHFRPLGEAPTVSVSTAKRVMEAVSKQSARYGGYIYTLAVHAATLSGQEDALYAMLDSYDGGSLKARGYEELMRYGRMKVFPKIKELAAGEDEKIVAAALDAPGNMPNATDKEKAEICPWAKGFLQDKRDQVYHAAGRNMLRCRGEYIDALLDEGEKRLEGGRFTREDSFVFRDICFSFIKGVTTEAGLEKQCERNYAFLEKAGNDERLTSFERAMALTSVSYQRRDAKSMAMLNKYKDHKDPEIQKYVRDQIKMLNESYKIPLDAKGDEAPAEQPAEQPAETGDKGGDKVAKSGPAHVGKLFARGFQAGDVTQTELMLNVQKDYLVLGSLKGLRDGKKFSIPLRGTLDKNSNSFTLTGSQGGSTVKVTGKVMPKLAAGGIEGKVFDKPINARYEAK